MELEELELLELELELELEDVAVNGAQSAKRLPGAACADTHSGHNQQPIGISRKGGVTHNWCQPTVVECAPSQMRMPCEGENCDHLAILNCTGRLNECDGPQVGILAT